MRKPSRHSKAAAAAPSRSRPMSAGEPIARDWWLQAAERAGRVDILVNNAGIAIRKPPHDYSPAEWRQGHRRQPVVGLLLRACRLSAHVRAGGGKIINIGSMMSIFGAPFAVAYGASKGGIVQMTKGLATAWAKDNIQSNAILPGWIDTPFTQTGRQQVPGLHERVIARTPAGRWGEPGGLRRRSRLLCQRRVEFRQRRHTRRRRRLFLDGMNRLSRYSKLKSTRIGAASKTLKPESPSVLNSRRVIDSGGELSCQSIPPFDACLLFRQSLRRHCL